MPTDLTEPGGRAAAISNTLTQLHREHYGRGATTVRTHIARDHVATILEDILTPMERTLLEAGDVETVRQARLSFQNAMSGQFIATVENATGRKVRAFFSQVHFDPDVSLEFFLLEPEAAEA